MGRFINSTAGNVLGRIIALIIALVGVAWIFNLETGQCLSNKCPEYPSLRMCLAEKCGFQNLDADIAGFVSKEIDGFWPACYRLYPKNQ